MTIQRSAYLSICPRCKQHGRIILPDGSQSKEFETKYQGANEVERLLAEHQIAKDEADMLKDFISDSRLSNLRFSPLDLIEMARHSPTGKPFVDGKPVVVPPEEEETKEKRTLN